MDPIVWISFIVLILALLALDLGVLNREPHEPTLLEALAWSGFWISLSLAFNALVYFLYDESWVGVGLAFSEHVSGREAAIEFFAAYVLEKSLSLDNIFVIALIFSYFKIPLKYQHRVLFWGVLGALVMRGMMIFAGAALISRFYWTTYLFGAILLVTAARMLVARHDNLEPDKTFIIRLVRRFMPVTSGIRGQHFVVREGGVLSATPLLLVLVMVEAADVLFAIDSVPAVFAITSDPFIVYTSNVFAILGLRALYFALAPLLPHFRFLKASLVFILAFVGVKMILVHHYPIPVPVSLAFILGMLVVGMVASILAHDLDTASLRSPVEDDMQRLMRLTKTIAIRVVVLATGSLLVATGGILIVIPAVGVKTIVTGLAVLASQFVWARTLLRRARKLAGEEAAAGGD